MNREPEYGWGEAVLVVVNMFEDVVQTRHEDK